MTGIASVWLLAPVLIWVAFCDLLYRRISNQVVLLLLLLWLIGPVVVLTGVVSVQSGYWVTLGHTVLGALGVLLCGFVLFQLRQVGAGDAKLIAVICLWVGVDEQLAFLIMTSLVGGVMALTLPFIFRLETALALGCLRFGQSWLKRPIPVPAVLGERCPPGIPYGIAIAAGAFYTLLIHIHY